jgi:hypothetical protein
MGVSYAKEVPMARRQAPQGVELELTECGFVIANRDWVYDPGLEGVEYVFGRTQRGAGLDSIIYGVLKFPVQHKRWEVRYWSLLAGIRREARERRVPPSQALWLVTQEALHDVLRLPELRGVWSDPDNPEAMAAWGKRLRRAMNREVSRRLLAPQRIAQTEVSLEELQELPATVPMEAELLEALKKLLSDPHLTPGDRRLVRALDRARYNPRLAAEALGLSEKAFGEQRRRLWGRLQAG